MKGARLRITLIGKLSGSCPAPPLTDVHHAALVSVQVFSAYLLCSR